MWTQFYDESCNVQSKYQQLDSIQIQQDIFHGDEVIILAAFSDSIHGIQYIGLWNTDSWRYGPHVFSLWSGLWVEMIWYIWVRGREKRMPAILQMVFSSVFWWNKLIFWFKFQWILLLRIQLKYTSIGSGNSLSLNRQQAITQTNVHQNLWCNSNKTPSSNYELIVLAAFSD